MYSEKHTAKMNLNERCFSNDLYLDDITTIRNETDSFAKDNYDPIQARILERRRNHWNLKVSVLKARAFVFDLLYGTGAHLKALIFLHDYKIPKKTYLQGDSSDEGNNGSVNSSELSSTSTESGDFREDDDGYDSTSTIQFPDHIKAVDGGPIRETGNVDDDIMLDILIITAEDDEIRLPPPQ